MVFRFKLIILILIIVSEVFLFRFGVWQFGLVIACDFGEDFDAFIGFRDCKSSRAGVGVFGGPGWVVFLLVVFVYSSKLLNW